MRRIEGKGRTGREWDQWGIQWIPGCILHWPEIRPNLILVRGKHVHLLVELYT